MASKKKEEEPPRNVPIITVRQQYTTKCGETCGGQGFGRDKQYPPCGPSPPSSTGELTCGLKDCMETDTCRCRCHCALRELMRQRAEEAADPTNVTSMTHETVIDQQVPLVHKARILTLDPRTPTFHIRRWPREQICHENRRHYYCRPPRYVHAVLENMLGPPPCPCGHQMVYYSMPNGVRDFWC